MGRNKLNAEQREAVRVWNREGVKTSEIVRRLAEQGVVVTSQTVRNVATQRTWCADREKPE